MALVEAKKVHKGTDSFRTEAMDCENVVGHRGPTVSFEQLCVRFSTGVSYLAAFPRRLRYQALCRLGTWPRLAHAKLVMDELKELASRKRN